jgi:hypothetical protein
MAGILGGVAVKAAVKERKTLSRTSVSPQIDTPMATIIVNLGIVAPEQISGALLPGAWVRHRMGAVIRVCDDNAGKRSKCPIVHQQLVET